MIGGLKRQARTSRRENLLGGNARNHQPHHSHQTKKAPGDCKLGRGDNEGRLGKNLDRELGEDGKDTESGCDDDEILEHDVFLFDEGRSYDGPVMLGGNEDQMMGLIAVGVGLRTNRITGAINRPIFMAHILHRLVEHHLTIRHIIQFHCPLIFEGLEFHFTDLNFFGVALTVAQKIRFLIVEALIDIVPLMAETTYEWQTKQNGV